MIYCICIVKYLYLMKVNLQNTTHLKAIVYNIIFVLIISLFYRVCLRLSLLPDSILSGQYFVNILQFTRAPRLERIGRRLSFACSGCRATPSVLALHFRFALLRGYSVKRVYT